MATLTVPVEKKKYEQEALITGAEAIAVACKLANVDVVTAYPIRPYDTVMQYISQLKADGEMDCEYIVAEGEHSQFEIVKHASICGARVFCGSSGVGWMYAMEALPVTPALSAWSITTRWPSATWAGTWYGWTAPRKPWTPRSSPTGWPKTGACS